MAEAKSSFFHIEDLLLGGTSRAILPFCSVFLKSGGTLSLPLHGIHCGNPEGIQGLRGRRLRSAPIFLSIYPIRLEPRTLIRCFEVEGIDRR